MIHWKKALTAGFLSLSLFAVPVGTAMAASWWQTLAYGAAAMTLAKQQLTKMDDGAKQQMLANTQAKTGVVAGEAYGDRLEGIQRNIVATGMIERQYDVYANPSEDLNAFETIGGVISVNKGMMDALNDDELAFTLCHEMQHGEKRHAVNGILKSIGIATLVDVALGGDLNVLDVLLGSVAVNYIDNEVVTMDQEKEADAHGFDVFKNTQYNVGGAASSMQLVYEQYGELYQEGFKRIINPNNHPQMTSRIEKLAFRMSYWSGNHVQVGGDVVYVNAQPVIQPVPTEAYSARRRAFLAAGNLARVTHNEYGEAIDEDEVQAVPLNQQDEKGKKANAKEPIYPPAWNVAQQGSDIYVNGLRIMTCAPGDDGAAITRSLEQALKAEPAMVSEKEIKKLNKEWKKQYEADKKAKDEAEKAAADAPQPAEAS